MIKSTYPERTGKHFVCYCNQQIPGTSDYNIAQAALRSIGDKQKIIILKEPDS